MKILYIFTFCLITGDGSSLEVTGYSGGGVLIKCKNTTLNPKYFCRASGSNCSELIKTENPDKWKTAGRFSLLYNSSAAELWVLITELTVDDSGRYQCGGDKDSDTSVNLNVTEDPLFGKSLSMTGHAGEDANISCKYPQYNKTESKFLCKRENKARCRSKVYIKLSGKWITKEPYSVYDDREQQIFTVTINNLTEENSGEYWCAVQSNDGNRLYITQINLTVIGPASPASSLITAVCVIVLLLLIGLLFFIIILRKRHKTQNTASTPSQSLHDSSNSHMVSHAVSDYEEIKERRHISGSSTVFSTPQLATNPSDPSQTVYGNVQPTTRPCDPLYASQTPSISPNHNTYSTAQLPPITTSDSPEGHAQQSSEKSAEGPTYTTLNFSKTSSCNATVTARTFKKEEDTCDYATVKHIIGSG